MKQVSAEFDAVTFLAICPADHCDVKNLCKIKIVRDQKFHRTAKIPAAFASGPGQGRDNVHRVPWPTRFWHDRLGKNTLAKTLLFCSHGKYAI